MAADSSASPETIYDRAHEQIGSGIELPKMELSDAPLYKVVPRGTDVTPHSPFCAREGIFQGEFDAGRRIGDYFALPIKSEAPIYDEMMIRPRGPTEIFVQRVAPTSELNGLVTKAGGGEQV